MKRKQIREKTYFIRFSPLRVSLFRYYKSIHNLFLKIIISLVKDIVQPKKRGIERGTIQTVLTSSFIENVLCCCKFKLANSFLSFFLLTAKNA